jgi:hypothetical protein
MFDITQRHAVDDIANSEIAKLSAEKGRLRRFEGVSVSYVQQSPSERRGVLFPDTTQRLFRRI